LKTPLTLITGYADLLLHSDDDETRRQAPLLIAEAAARLDDVLDRVLAILLEADHAIAQRFLQRREPASPGWEPAPAIGRETDNALRSRVLLVDDDPELRQLLRLTLQTRSLELIEARDGREALALFAQDEPDLVVLDWEMPESTGAEVLEQLARRGIVVPVIVLTTNGDEQTRRLARSLGASAFLGKPFSPIGLLDEIEAQLAPTSDLAGREPH
jgi:CheY-like chemotaxis protein